MCFGIAILLSRLYVGCLIFASRGDPMYVAQQREHLIILCEDLKIN